MNKTVIAPIVTVVLLVVTNIFGVKLPSGTDQQITDLIANALALYVIVVHGIMKNHTNGSTQNAVTTSAAALSVPTSESVLVPTALAQTASPTSTETPAQTTEQPTDVPTSPEVR